MDTIQLKLWNRFTHFHWIWSVNSHTSFKYFTHLGLSSWQNYLNLLHRPSWIWIPLSLILVILVDRFNFNFLTYCSRRIGKCSITSLMVLKSFWSEDFLGLRVLSLPSSTFWAMRHMKLPNRRTLRIIIKSLRLRCLIKLCARKFIQHSLNRSHWSLRLVIKHPWWFMSEFETLILRASSRCV